MHFLGMAFVSAIAAGALIGVPAVASAATPADASSATDAASCVSEISTHLVRLTGTDDDPVENPVLLVHGWLSTVMPEAESGPRPVTTSTGIANSPFSRPVAWSSDGDPAVDLRSLQERLTELPDTSVFAFDYSSIAALWVGHTATAPALAGAIECLAAASGQPVDIVAHSMGGLALRYALGGTDEGVAQHVGQVTLAAGDGIVEVDSATAGAATAFVARCDVTVDLTTTDGSDRFADVVDEFGGIPPLSGPCAHDRLFENDDVVRDIVATLEASRG